ncbi:MAG TPA: class I SAM-dependent methyltransferase [Gemmatimonadales bacterium]|nr:class I SAM-dependent methyltransferase [Gemmatimonadales bacterium]
MSGAAPSSGIESVADTARWVAMYRALETERRDAHFSDPFARRLAGPRGVAIYDRLPRQVKKAAWSVIARTTLLDRRLDARIQNGTTLVVNLAAGLDSRPYRLALPPHLRWIEVDNPDLLEEKARILADATPRCRLERIGVDLADAASRKALLERLPSPGDRAVVITEGLLMYLSEPDVTGLARDLAAVPAYRAWLTDLISPGLLQLINREWGSTLEAGGALMRFAPSLGTAFFEPLGWRATGCDPTILEARRLRRLPFFLHLLAGLPGVGTFHAKRPWSAVCELTPLEAGAEDLA